MHLTLVAVLLGGAAGAVAQFVNATTSSLPCAIGNTTETVTITSFVTLDDVNTTASIFSFEVANGTTSWIAGMSPSGTAITSTVTETSTVQVTAVPASAVSVVTLTETITSTTVVTQSVTQSVSGVSQSTVSAEAPSTLTIYDTVTSTLAVTFASPQSTFTGNSSVLTSTSTSTETVAMQTIVVTQTQQITLTASRPGPPSLTPLWTNTTSIAGAQSTSSSTQLMSSIAPNVSTSSTNTTSTSMQTIFSTVNVYGELTVSRIPTVALSPNSSTSLDVNATFTRKDAAITTSLLPTPVTETSVEKPTPLVAVTSTITLTLSPTPHFFNTTLLKPTPHVPKTSTVKPNLSPTPHFVNATMVPTLVNSLGTISISAETPTPVTPVGIVSTPSISYIPGAHMFPPMPSNWTTILTSHTSPVTPHGLPPSLISNGTWFTPAVFTSAHAHLTPLTRTVSTTPNVVPTPLNSSTLVSAAMDQATATTLASVYGAPPS